MSEVKAAEAWVAPDGRFHPVLICGHYDAAIKLGDATGGDILELRGWAHISAGTIQMAASKRLTQAQMDTLFDLLLAYRAAEYPYLYTFEEEYEAAVATS